MSTSRIPAKGAVLGLDVGYSKSKATTGLCVLTWDESAVTWDCRNARSDDEDRLQHLRAIAGQRQMLAAAVDGPLVPGLGSHSLHRACEAILSRRRLQKMGKPGSTAGGSGPDLHAEATRLAKFSLAHLQIEKADHAYSIHERRIVEAFPNMFLGSLCDMAGYPSRPTSHRKWTDTLFPIARPQVESLLRRLLPGREIAGDWSDDHEAIAGFTCAVTALCVVAGEYTAVGATDDGWIILPPKSVLGDGWVATLTDCCRRSRSGFPRASIAWIEGQQGRAMDNDAPAARFDSCRWRAKPAEGAFCTHSDVRPLAGEQSFSPTSWCGDCAHYKQRRAPTESITRRRGWRQVGGPPDLVGFGVSQTVTYFTGHPYSPERSPGETLNFREVEQVPPTVRSNHNVDDVLPCPIPGCLKTWPNGRGGWDRHVEVPRMHPAWHPTIHDADERKALFKREFPEFFRCPPPAKQFA